MTPKEIPVSFTIAGQHYSGTLSFATGSGEHAWYLMIDKYYCGRLRCPNGEWVFDPTPKTQEFAQLAEFFGSCVVSATDSQQ